MKQQGERLFLTYEEAIELLPDGETIHCFKNPGAGMLIGADWGRKDVLETLRKASSIEVSGPQAQAMGHGLVVDERNYFEAANYEEKHPAAIPSSD